MSAEYCLGAGRMKRCATCQHEKTWNAYNQMPDVLRRSLQAAAKRINNDECEATDGCHYRPEHDR